MRAIVLSVGLLTAGCSTVYWDRPGARLPDLAFESQSCYEAALASESPSALAVTSGSPSLLPRTKPPPALWKRAPRQAGFERFDEQVRYERCMRARGWQPAPGAARVF
jgi:hypothetical protein